MRLAPIAVAGLLAGCFAKPDQVGGVGGDAGRDAVDDAGETGDGPIGCEFSAFSGLVYNDSVTGEPTIRGDGNEFFYAYQENAWEIRSGTRSSGTGPFTLMTNVPSETVETIDQDPSITDDGNLMVYRSIKSSAFPYVVQIVRTGETWSSPPVPVLTGERVHSIDLSDDGKTLYFTVDGGILRKAVRGDLTSQFTVEGADLGTFIFPTVSRDGLTLFHSDGTAMKDLSAASRPSPTGPFGSSSMVAVNRFDPDLANDGHLLIVATDSGGVMVATRSCVP